ncbi:Vomeronasal 2, receptor 16 [Apodemus speciosus]|uniref:Vomeronasal 2, receptor 16 n=1 Tax=Apodemus speciosus TaxID=105296 RepID=A0ABQ0FVY3_APOSI
MRIPARCYKFFLVMFFAIGEINKSLYLLPNMSLMFTITEGLIQDTLSQVDSENSQQNNSMYFMNYFCYKYEHCDVELTGPSWKISAKLAFNTRTPK